jgi:hypothetical protein
MVKSYLLHQHEALGIGNNLGGVQGLLKILKELFLVALKLAAAARDVLKLGGSLATLGLDGRQATGQDSLGNQSDGHTQVQCIDGGPLASTLLASLVKNLLNKRLAIVIIVVHDVTGNLNQERVQDTLIPLGENVANLLAGETQTTLHDIVGLEWENSPALTKTPSIKSRGVVFAKTYLANELHVTVLNTVVNHLDVVASTLVADPFTAGLAVALGGDALEDVLDVRPGLLVTTRHERGTVSGTLLTTGNTGSDESDALSGQVPGATVGVGEVRVTTINDDVALLQEGQQLLNPVIDSLTGLDEQHDTARGLELADKLLDAVSANNGRALGFVFQESVDLGDSSVESANGEAVVGHVHDEILSPVDDELVSLSGPRGKGLRRTWVNPERRKDNRGGGEYLHDSEANEAQIRAWNIVSIS